MNSLSLIENILPKKNMGFWIDLEEKLGGGARGTGCRAFGGVFDVIVRRISKNSRWADKNKRASQERLAWVS